jgi:hypothetical protein
LTLSQLVRLPNSSDAWTGEHTLKTSKEERTRGKVGLSKEVDILQGPDKAETGRSSGDPIMRKLRTTPQDGRKKYNGSKEMARYRYSQRSHTSENA